MNSPEQYSRLLHHTNTTGLTFSVPASEDIKTWNTTNLGKSEIGVDEASLDAYIRIGSTIRQFSFSNQLPQEVDESCCDQLESSLEELIDLNKDIEDKLDTLISATGPDCCDIIQDTLDIISGTLSRVDHKIDSIINGLKPVPPIIITKIEKVKEIQYKVIETTIYKETKDPSKIGTKKVREINYGTIQPAMGWEPGPRGWYIKHAKYGRTYYSPNPKGKPLYSEDEFNKMFKSDIRPSYRHLHFPNK